MSVVCMLGCGGDDASRQTTCGLDTQLSADGRRCEAIAVDGPVRCGAGTILDALEERCMRAQAPFVCADGTRANSGGDGCVVDGLARCGRGTRSANNGGSCVAIERPPSVRCGTGTSPNPSGECGLEAEQYSVPWRPVGELAWPFYVVQAEMGANGVVHILSRDSDDLTQIVRFDPVAQMQYTDIEVAHSATAFALDPVSGDLFIGDTAGRVERIAGATGERTVYLQQGFSVRALWIYDDWLFTQFDGPVGRQMRIYDKATGEERYRYDGLLPGDFDTVIGIAGEDLLLWIDRSSSTGVRRARITPDGFVIEDITAGRGNVEGPLHRVPGTRTVITGSGSILDFDENLLIDATGLVFQNIAFVDDRVVLSSRTAAGGRIRVLDRDFTQLSEYTLEDVPIRLLEDDDRLYAVTRYGIGVRFVEISVQP